MGPERTAAGGRGFTTADVARLCGVSPSTIRRYVARGWLASTKEGGAYRFGWTEVSRMRAWVKASRGAPARVARALRLGRPTQRLRLVGRSVVFVDADGAFEPTTGQSILDLENPGANAPVARVPTWPGFIAARDRGELGRARALLESHVCAHPSHATAWVELGKIHVVSGELEHAIEAFESALRCAEGDTEARARARICLLLGEVLEDVGRDDAAGTVYERALALDATLADAHFNAAGVFERLGDRWRALRHLHAYRRMRPM